MANDWLYPETWQVGDKLDAATLNRRICDQNTLLLRRPLTVATNSGNLTASNGADFAITFDTVSIDDDGMNQTGTPVTNWYAQREGTYQIWLNVTLLGTGVAPNNLQSSLWVQNNSTYRHWDVQAKGASAVGQICCRSNTGTIYMNVGEYVTAHCYQDSGASMTVSAQMSTPRIALMWLGIS